MECIILAGGLGTRLQSVVADVPKCMAPVNGLPFLQYVFDYIESQGCTHLVLSLGYKHEIVTGWLATQQRPFNISYVIEEEPLGTGGGIQLALDKTQENNVFILNGDTMFRADLAEMSKQHQDKTSDVTIALKTMHQFERYGTVKMNDDLRITSFEEKKYCKEGLINGGIYLLNKSALLSKQLPVKFSMEKDYFEAFVQNDKMHGFVTDAYFIDIGIPADYEQAQHDFKNSDK